MRYVLLTLTLLFTTFFPKSIIAKFSPEEISQILQKVNGELLVKFGDLGADESCYLEVGDSLIIIPQGHHYVFSYTRERGGIERLDRSVMHGHNFLRKIFLYNDEIYAFGGYGFWQTHGKLIRFSRQTHEWELVLLKGAPPTGLPAISFLKGDTLFAFYNIEKHPELNVDSISRNAYMIDMRTKIATKFKIKNNNHFDYYRPSLNDQNSRYAFYGFQGSILHIFDKVEFKFYTTHGSPNLFKGYPMLRGTALDSNFVVIYDETIRIFPKNAPALNFPIQDYLDLYCTSIEMRNQLVPIDKKEGFVPMENVWIIGIGTAILVLLFWFLGKLFLTGKSLLKSRWSKVYDVMNQQPYFAAIRTLSPGIYSEKEIDIVLRIVHIPKHIRKLKRITLLEELNRLQPGFIEKYPAEKEGTSRSYRINYV